MLFPVYFCKRKAKAARLEQECTRTPSLKALFASSEGVKCPTFYSFWLKLFRTENAFLSSCAEDS
ncbi:hypothetical protein COM84_11745 [Bacillus thuringiensis]|nr:hypothetical protein COM84_11745 [Bacillus thuringiensis]